MFMENSMPHPMRHRCKQYKDGLNQQKPAPDDPDKKVGNTIAADSYTGEEDHIDSYGFYPAYMDY